MQAPNVLVQAAFERVYERTHELRHTAGVEVIIAAPDLRSTNPRLYVLIESPSVIAQIGVTSSNTLKLGAMDLQSSRVLLDASVCLQRAEELDVLIEPLLLLFEGVVAHASSTYPAAPSY